MSTIDELFDQGYRKMRMPQWDSHAYVEPDVLSDDRIGPWTNLYGVLYGVGGEGKPMKLLTLQCVGDGWEPVGEAVLMRTDPRNNPEDAYNAFMSMPQSEWLGLVGSLLRGGVLTPAEQEGFERAQKDRPGGERSGA